MTVIRSIFIVLSSHVHHVSVHRTHAVESAHMVGTSLPHPTHRWPSNLSYLLLFRTIIRNILYRAKFSPLLDLGSIKLFCRILLFLALSSETSAPVINRIEEQLRKILRGRVNKFTLKSRRLRRQSKGQCSPIISTFTAEYRKYRRHLIHTQC